MKDYKEAIESIMKDTTSKVIEHAINAYHQGLGKAQTDSYVKGYEDGKADTPFTDTEEAKKTAYEQGLNEAWEAAKKIALMDTETSENVTGYFGLFRIMDNLTASEAIAKIKEYEDKQKQDAEIKVGDEIRLHDATEVVTSVMSTGLQTIDASGNTSTWYYDTYPLETWKKTGRHFPQIAEVLAELRGAE